MKNVNKIALGLAFMLFVGLLSNSNSAYAQDCRRGGSVGIHLPNIGLHIDDYGVRLHGPRLNIDTRNYNRYSSPRYDYRDPGCRTPYSTYPRYDYGRPRYTPSYPPTYNRYNNHDNRRYQDQLRKQREYQERLRREQERYKRNMDRILRDLRRDCD